MAHSGRGGDREGNGRPKNPEKSGSIWVPDSLAEALRPKLEVYRRKLGTITSNKSLSEEEKQQAIDDLGLCGPWMFPPSLRPRTISLPCFSVAATPGAAGFADETAEEMEILSSLVDDPQGTFLVKVSGDSMKGVDIKNGDILVVERRNKEKDIKQGQVVIASFASGSQVVKLFHRISKNKIQLISANNSDKYPTISISGDSQEDIKIEGIVRHYGVTMQWVVQADRKPFPAFNVKDWI